MLIQRFVERQQANWRRLEELTQRSRGRVESLTPAEIYELGRLYRITTSDLALAQRDYANQRVTTYLNQLVGQAHAVIYREEPLTTRTILRFFTHDFPVLYRKIGAYTLVAFVLFLLPALVAFFLVSGDPETIYLLLGRGIEPLVERVEAGELWTEIAPSARSAASSVIATNNIQVTFLAFAGSMTLGIFTVWILLLNGMNLGAIFGLLAAHGMTGGLLEFVLAHGFVELSVIFLAGGCGLYIGDGILRPGLHRRSVTLIQRARVGVSLILGTVPLLVLAGLIEGFISPSDLGWPLKLLVGLTSGVLLHLYWLRAGRDSHTQSASLPNTPLVVADRSD